MPFCANCGWRYAGVPRFCRDCGRPILRRAPGGRRPPSPTIGPARVLPVVPRPEAAAERWRRRGLVLGLALLAALAFLLVDAAYSTTALGTLPSDEAWVRLVYARNLAQSAALEFNPGQGEPGLGSILWIVLMALQIKILAAIGINVIALAKGTSLLAAAAAAVLAGELAHRLTRSRAAALAAGGLVALDPTFGFAGAAGVETTLVAALALATALVLLDGRRLATGLLAALAVLASLEAVVLLPLLAAASIAPHVLALGRRHLPTRGELIGLALGLGPPVLAVSVWLWLDRPPSQPLPGEFYVARASRPGLPLPDVVAFWRGYAEPSVGYFRAGAWIVAVPAMLFGAWHAVREHSWRALPTLLFAPLVVLGIIALLPLPHDPWAFSIRRHLDAILPFLAVGLIVGARALWIEAGRVFEHRVPLSALRRPTWALGVAAVPMLTVALPAASLLSLWGHLPAEYASATRAAADGYFALARFVRDSVPEPALVAALEPGAIRYVSRHPVADLGGVHTPILAGRPPLDALAEARAEYAALPRTRLWDSAPGTTLIREFPAPGESPDVPRIGLFRLSFGSTNAPRDAVYAFPTDRLSRLDYLDVGNDTAERDHGYTVTEERGMQRRTMRVTEDRAVADDGRVWIGSEAVALRADPGRDLIVARRFDGFAPGGFRVTVDGQPVAEWWPRAGAYGLAEDTLRVPGRLVRSPRVVFRLELIPDSATETASYGYWSFAETQ